MIIYKESPRRKFETARPHSQRMVLATIIANKSRGKLYGIENMDERETTVYYSIRKNDIDDGSMVSHFRQDNHYANVPNPGPSINNQGDPIANATGRNEINGLYSLHESGNRFNNMNQLNPEPYQNESDENQSNTTAWHHQHYNGSS